MPREQNQWSPDRLEPASTLQKKATVVDRVAKWGKYGLYNNNGLVFCKPYGKKVGYLREVLSSTTSERTSTTLIVHNMYVVAHHMCWLQGMRNVRSAGSSKHRKSKSGPKKHVLGQYKEEKWDVE